VASKARRLALQAAQEAAERAGTAKGEDATRLALSFAVLELAHQMGRLADAMPVFGPPEER